ncbi:MAG: SGNH/GDSL hydrolase family protein [Acidimicrobiales bacterium]
MAAGISSGFSWLGVLMVTLAAPSVVDGLGWNDPWIVTVVSALLGALSLWNINVAYAAWITDPTRWDVRRWLTTHLTLAALGIAVVAVAALIMAWSSTENLQIGIANALGFWLAGTVPVVQVVRARLGEITGTTDAVPFAVAWGLNALLIAGTTLLPAALLTGWERSGVVAGLVAFAVWLAFEVARRAIVESPWLVGLGAFCMLLPAAFVLFADADRVRWPILFLFPVGLALVSARRRPRLLGRVGPVAPPTPDAWKVTALIGLVALAVGLLWWVLAIGDDVSRVAVFAGVAGAMLFGASLVTRGEGLVVLVLLGLVMVWVVQDHTGGPAPDPAVDAPAVLAAFGDSYLSGDGIGSFYEDTNTAGRRDLSARGINECRRSEFAYSPLVAADRGLELAFYGCSGALATTGATGVLSAEDEAVEFESNSVYGQLLRWEVERGNDNDPELVLLSLGGNDAGFAKIGAACFLPGSCDNALDASSTPALEGVTARAATAIGRARELFPTSPIVVVAYPQMFGPDADACGGQVPFNGTETIALRKFVEALNRAVGLAVADVGGDQVVHFTAAAAAYEGARFCELGADGTLVAPDAIRALAFQPTEGDDLLDRLSPVKIIHNTFHPTRLGHELMAAELVAFLDADCHVGATSTDCASATARPVMSGPVEPTAEGDDGEIPDDAEVVVDAPVGGCNELDSFNQCTIMQSLRLVLVSLAAIALGGLMLTRAAGQAGLVGRLLRRLPFAGFVSRVTPL